MSSSDTINFVGNSLADASDLLAEADPDAREDPLATHNSFQQPAVATQPARYGPVTCGNEAGRDGQAGQGGPAPRPAPRAPSEQTPTTPAAPTTAPAGSGPAGSHRAHARRETPRARSVPPSPARGVPSVARPGQAGDEFDYELGDDDWEPGPAGMAVHAVSMRPLSREQLLKLGAAGGVAALKQRVAHTSRGASISHQQIRAVPETSILALFGQSRTALLRLSVDVSADGLRSYKYRRVALDICVENGTAIPDDVSRALVFFQFQQDHSSIIRTAPMPVALVAQWMHGFGRWAVRDRGDETISAEFDYITKEATRILAELVAVERSLQSKGGIYLRAGTRKAATDLVIKFSAFRTAHVRKLVDVGLGHAMLGPLHEDFRTILAAYEQLHAAVPRYIDGIQRQVDTEGTAHSNVASEQEEFISHTLGAVFRAFIRGLLGNSLKSPEGGHGLSAY